MNGTELACKHGMTVDALSGRSRSMLALSISVGLVLAGVAASMTQGSRAASILPFVLLILFPATYLLLRRRSSEVRSKEHSDASCAGKARELKRVSAAPEHHAGGDCCSGMGGGSAA